MTYTVFGTKTSRTFRVLWALEELGLDYVWKDNAPRSDIVRALSPNGKVPVLVDGDTSLTDSTAIMQYLADKHGGLTFAAGTIERAKQDGFTHFVLDELDSTLWTAARHSFILPKDKRVPEVKDSLKWEFQLSVDELMRRMGDGPYLMGDTITVADIIAAHCGNWAFTAKFPQDNADFAAYCKRLRVRDAFQRVKNA